jgi:protein-S-isoprenylcysteine O-methyltransferase Ste14
VPIPSDRYFKAVSTALQVSTLVIALASFWSDAALLAVVSRPMAVIWAGIGTCLAGCALFFWSRRTLGAAYSPCYDSYVANAIVDCGPYAMIRHPIYSANVAYLVGVFLMSGSPWIAMNAVVLAGFYARAARAEEISLAASLPGYPDYQARTSRFVPSARGLADLFGRCRKKAMG